MLGMRVQVLGTSMMRFFSHELWSHRDSAMYRIDTTEICMTYHPLSQSWTVGGNTISCEKLDVITSTEC